MTSAVLASTLLVPLIAGLINTGAPDTVKTSQRISSYLSGKALVADKSQDESGESAAKDSATNTDTENSNQQADQEDKTAANTQAAGTNSTSKTAKDGVSAGAKSAGKYVVKSGDTYGCIAESYYGSYEQWPKVYVENAGWPGFGEYSLAVGANLIMPAVSAADALPATSLCAQK